MRVLPLDWWIDPPMPGILKKTRTTLEMIKWEHSIFALPFAFTAVLLAAHGLPAARTIGWILVAMVAARSAAMAYPPPRTGVQR